MNVIPVHFTTRFGYSVDFKASASLRAIDEGSIQRFMTAAIGFSLSSNTDEELPKLQSEGSFSQVWIHGSLCARFTRIREGMDLLHRIDNALNVVTPCSIVDYIYTYGFLVDSNGRTLGFLLVMDLLHPIGSDFSDIDSLDSALSRIARLGFHNDLKVDNVMLNQEGTKVCVIDFDLLSPTTLTIALSGTSFIELDLSPFIATLGEQDSFTQLFRLYYDYTCLSLSINAKHGLYLPVLTRLVSLYHQMEAHQYLTKLRAFLGDDKVRDIPVEVLIRCPDGVEGVSVNLFDLRGNAFAHGLPNWDNYPSIFRSTGVYWPTR